MASPAWVTTVGLSTQEWPQLELPVACLRPFGREAKLTYLPWEEWKTRHSAAIVEQTYDHIAHSPSCSIEKAQRHLGYQPRYSSFEGVRDAVDWLIGAGIVTH